MANLIPYDDGTANTFTATAAVAVSGATLYTAGSYTNTVAAAETYDYTEILVTAIASGNDCLGLALYDRASGTSNEVALLRRGIVLARANAAVLAGQVVAPATATADGLPVVGPVPVVSGAQLDSSIGRVMQTAASGERTYLLLNI